MKDTVESPPRPRAWLVALALGAIFVAAWVLRVSFALDYEAHHPLAQRPVIDEASYERWALRLAHGEGGEARAFFQEPLYPIALGAVYRSVAARDPAQTSGRSLLERQRTAARHAQAFLGALTVLFVFGTTRRVFGLGAAFVAAAGLAFYRPLLMFPSYLLKPNLLLPILALLVYLIVRLGQSADPRRLRSLVGWFVVGTLGALAALLRGNVLVLLPVLAALPVLRMVGRGRKGSESMDSGRPGRRMGESLGIASCVVSGILACLLPVALRNLKAGGVFALTTIGAGTNVYGGNNLENVYGVAFEPSFVRGIPEHELEDWKREAERRLGREIADGDVSTYWLVETATSVLDHPLAHLGILVRKLGLTLGSYEVPDNHHLAWDARFWPMARLPFPGYALLGWFGVAGIVFFFFRPSVRDPARARELAFAYLLYVGTIVLTVMSMRARLALLPLLAPFAGHFVASFFTAERRRNAPWAFASLALTAIPVFLPIIDARERVLDFDERELNHVVYQLQQGNTSDDVVGLAHELAQRHPGAPRIRVLSVTADYHRARRVLGEAGLSEARRQETLQGLREGLGVLKELVDDPRTPERERFRARRIAGLIQLEYNDPAAAERHLRSALDFDPTDETCRLSLANALFLQAIEVPPDERSRAWLYESEGILRELIVEQGGEAPRFEELWLEVWAELLLPPLRTLPIPPDEVGSTPSPSSTSRPRSAARRTPTSSGRD